MNFKLSSFILILLLLISIGCVAASEIDDNITISQETQNLCDNITQNELNSVDSYKENIVLESYNHEVNNTIESDYSQEVLAVGESDDVIVVSTWDELQYYCSLKDDDYTLKLKDNTSFYPTNPSDSNYQIKVYNNVKIIGGEGSYIGYNSSSAPLIKYAAIVVPDNYKSSIYMENVTFKWISVGYSSDGVFIQMGGRRNNVFKNCNFNNIVTWIGHSCVVYLKRGTATLDNCSFINCKNGYGVVSVYDPNSVKSTDMIVRNCYFEGNYATTEPGCINNCGKLTVYNTTFIKNRSYWWAGAIHTHSGGSTTIYDSNFTDNVAGWNGGALYTYGYLNIYNTVFVGNNCTTNSGGGAIGACSYGSDPHIYIENCLFEKNSNNCWGADQLSNSAGYGGAIAIMDDGSIVVLNTTFIANSAACGCAISAVAAGEYGSPDVYLVNNSFINHTSSETLLVSVKGSTAILEGNYFEGNYVVFKELTLSSVSSGKDYATLKVDVSLSNLKYYDSDIMDKIGYNVYVNGEYVKTVNSNMFTVDFDEFDICDVYVIPTISNKKSNEVRVYCLRDYIYVSKELGDDSFDGLSRATPVSTITHALELAGSFQNILILDGFYDEGNLEVNYDLTIRGEGNATLTNSTSFTVNANNLTIKNIKICNLTANTFIKQTTGDLLISNCIFNNNGVATLLDANNVNVVKSIFTNNRVVSSNNGFTSISNSILLNNSIIAANNLDNVVFDYNWWGNTLNNLSKPNTLNINNWLVLDATATKTSLEYGQSSSVQFGCYLVNGTDIVKYDDLVKFNLEVSALNGTVNKNSVYYNSNVVYTQTTTDNGVLTVKYDNVLFNLYFDFVKPVPNLSIKAPDILVGQDLDITILGPSDISESKGTFKVTVLGVKSRTQSTANNVFRFSNVAAGEYVVTVVFSGNDKYASHEISSKVSVNKYSTTTKITTGNVVVGSDLTLTVTTTQNTAGNVTLSINNITETLILSNNQATYTISNIGRGDYNIKAVYNGNEKYAVSQDFIFIEVDNQDPEMSVSIANSIYGDASIVEVVLNDDASGLVTASVEGITNSSEVVNGRAKIYIYGVNVGDNHKVSLFYSGDDTYFNKTATAYMNVFKGNFTFAMNSEDIYIGHDAVITIFVPAKTKGTFTIDDEVLNIPMSGEVSYTLKDLKIGNYTITATFNSDNYNTVSNSTSFKVMEFDTPQWANDGANTENTQKSDYTSEGIYDVLWTVEINSTVVSNLIIDSEGNVYVATADGIYSYDCEGNLRWIYSQEGVYGSGFAGLTIGRDVIISPKAGDTIYFVNQNGTRYGYSNIYQASSLFAPIIDANANIYTVSEYQYETSSYNLVITPYNLWENGGDPILIGLGNFKPSAGPSVNEDIYVVVGEKSIMVIDADNNEPVFIKTGSFKNVRPVIGEGNLIYTILGDSIVTYRVDGGQFNPLMITGGAGDNLLVDDDLGLVYATNSYGNLYSYDVLNGEEILISDLNITSGILIDGNHNLYFASENIFYCIDPNGEVLWKSNLGSRITSNPIMNKDGIIYVTSTDNKLFALSNKTSDTVKGNVSLRISASDVNVGEDAIIQVTSSLSSIKITVQVNNREFNITGSGSVRISDLAAGKYNAIVRFAGDDNFNPASNSTSFNVLKVKIQVTDGTFTLPDANSTVCSVNLPSDATGTLTVTVDGKTYTQTVTNGKATVNIHKLNDGSHNITVTYSGDGKYEPITKISVINVNNTVEGNSTGIDNSTNSTGDNTTVVKENPVLVVSAEDIYVGESVVVNVKTSVETGKIIVNVNNVDYELVISNGESSVSIPELAVGIYDVIARFAGDDRFNEATNSTEFRVLKVNVPLTNETISIPEGSSTEYRISLPSDATGSLTVTIDGKNYTETLTNGKATVNIPELSEGSHNITVTYSGDSKYSPITKSGVVVKEHVPVIKLTGSNLNMIYSSGKYFKVRLTSDGKALSGKTVKITINSKTYSRTTDKNGYASMKITLAPKAYNVKATYGTLTIAKKVTVKSIISAKNVNAKKSAKTVKIKVTLKKVNKKYLKNKKITLKFNKKTFKAKTNKKGVATFTIKNSVYKKLKANKKYTYQVIYGKDKVKKTIKFKR